MIRYYLALALLLGGCALGPSEQRVEGQDSFISAAPNGLGQNNEGYAQGSSNDARATAAPEAPGDSLAESSSGGTKRTLEETDLYKIDGDRLYYLNGYRGLMVFDISNIDSPRLLGRSAIYGTPIEMVVNNGIASIVVADWFGAMDDGTPFHGSIVRTLDATDPTNIVVKGEAKLGGSVRDVRRVGDVLYAVSEDYGWSYGWYYGGDVAVSIAPGGGGSNKVIISSVNISNGAAQTGQLIYEGYSGIFNVTANAILFARNVASSGTKTELIYVDISDPAGSIRERGKLQVNGRVQGYGVDNGRFNLDFYQERYARLLGCNADYCGGSNSTYLLQTVDFANPDAPTLLDTFNVKATGWNVAARFDGARLYLSPSDGYYGGSEQGTPIKVFDLSDPADPKLKGEATIDGNVWMFMPSGDKLFALGSDYDGVDYGNAVTVHYLDVSGDPTVLGTAAFGDGWTWTPAAGTFKAFTLNLTDNLVALPFSGWSYKDNSYNNGVQLVEFSPTTITTRGAAKTQGWVSRGVFANGRLLSMSDTALSIIDFSDRMAPTVVKEVVLARNVIDTVPLGDRVALLSTDWYDNDLTTTELRILPTSNADESQTLDALGSIAIEGTNARLFANGALAYVITNVRKEIACDSQSGTGSSKAAELPGGDSVAMPRCYSWTQRATVVDLSGDAPVKRGSIELPDFGGWSWGWGFYGCFAYDWYGGADLVQIQNDAIAVRRWYPVYGSKGFESAKHALFIIDLKDPDAPSIGSTSVTEDTSAWWGNLRAIGNDLYATSWEWNTARTVNGSQRWYVSYFLNKIDLTDRAHPRINARINVPGILVGGSTTDSSLLYTMDYRWANDGVVNELAVVRLKGNKASLVSSKEIAGASGSVFVNNDHAVFSAQDYGWKNSTQVRSPSVKLYDVDLSDPKNPVERQSAAQQGWGWLLGVEGDRALVTSGWGSQGADIYQLSPGNEPVFESTVRTRGWWASSLHREGDKLFLSSGYWGAQVITLPE